MVGVGVAACLAYLGWLPSGNLERLVNLWPLLLIAAGVGILFRDRSPWLGLTLGLVIVAGIFIVGFAGAQLGLASGASWFPDIGHIQFGDEAHQNITGSGKLVTENRPVSGVNRVELAVHANLEIQQGSNESLSVTGDDNILPVLLTDVSGGRLTIRYKPQFNVRIRSPLKILLTVKDLRELRLSSSGNVKVVSLTTSDFVLTLTSSCNVNIQGIQADMITTRISSSGDITIQGNANALDLNVTSSGSFQGGDLRVQKAAVKLTSSGEVTLWVVNDLRANISSSGNIAYYGSPAVSQSITSSGRLIPMGDK
jgi:hypothetical protein